MSDPEVQRRFLGATRALRSELLLAAVDYGVALAVSGGDYDGALQILGWADRLVEQAYTQADQAPRTDSLADSPSRWPRPLIADIHALQDLGVEPPGFVPDESSRTLWIARLEKLAALGRAVEEFGVEPLGERVGDEFDEGVTLLGAIEDSYTLSLSTDDQQRSRRMAPEELAQRLEAAREAFTWDGEVAFP